MGEKKKMAFSEIAKGMLSQDVQEDFERAQVIAARANLPTKVKLEITVYPPDPNEEFETSVSYSHSVAEPTLKSRKFIVIHDNGIITRDAQEPLEQLNLDLEKPELIFQKKQS